MLGSFQISSRKKNELAFKQKNELVAMEKKKRPWIRESRAIARAARRGMSAVRAIDEMSVGVGIRRNFWFPNRFFARRLTPGGFARGQGKRARDLRSTATTNTTLIGRIMDGTLLHGNLNVPT